MKAEESAIDQLFPIIDLLLKNIEIPNFLYIILAFYVFIQIYSTSFWPGLPQTVDYTTPVGYALHFIFQIAFLSTLEDTDADLTITFIILLVVTVITVIIFIIQISTYKVKRRLVRWTLYPTKFVLEFLPLILLIPTGNYIGMVFSRILNNPSPMIIAYFAMGIVIFCVILAVEYVQSFFFSMSPYIPKTIIFSSEGSFFILIFSVIPAFLVTPYLFQVFSSWINPLLIALKMLFNLYVISYTFYMPFMRRKVNIIFAAVFLSSTVLDLSAFIIVLGTFITELIQLILWISSLIVFYIMFHFILNKRFNRVKKNLSQDKFDSLTKGEGKVDSGADDAVREYYFSLDLAQSKMKLSMYLRVGLENMSPMFLNWSLIKFAADFVDDRNMILQMTKMICLFPCESRLLKFMYIKCNEKLGLKFHERFMLYQIHHVMNQRQSASSLEITTKLTELRQQSLGGVKSVRNFWLDVPSSPDVFYQVYTEKVKVVDYYSEAVLQWPNCNELYKDFANYLVECGADFVNGVKKQYIANLIEQGKNYAIDYSFKSLVRLYPYYLKRNVIDIKGNFIKNMKKTGSMSSVNSKNSDISSGTVSGELDFEIEEAVSVTLFTQHRLRMAFQRAIEHKKSSNSFYLKLSATMSYLILIALLVFLYIFFSTKFEGRQRNLRSARMLEQVRVGLDLSVVSLLLKWGDSLSLFSDAFKKDVATTHVNSININADLTSEAVRWTYFGVSNLDNFMSELVIMGTSGEKVIQDLRPVFEDLMVFNFCDDYIMIPKIVNTSLRNAFTFCFAQSRELIQEKATSSSWNTSSDMCTLFSNLDDLYLSYDDMQSSLTKRQNEDKDIDEEQNSIMMIAITIAFAVVTSPFLFVFFFRYYAELKGQLEMLRNVDIDVRKEAAKTFKDNSNLEQDSIESNEANDSIRPVVPVIIIIFSLIIGLVLLFGMILIGDEQNKMFKKISNWLDEAMDRLCYMGEILLFSTITMIQVNGNLDLKYTSINATTSSLNSSSNNLDKSNDNLLHGLNGKIACVGINAEFDALNLYERCVPNEPGFYESYQCAPIDKAIALLITLVDGIVRNPTNFTIENGSYYAHIFNIVNVHLIPPGLRSVDILIEEGQETIGTFSQWNLILAICGIVYCVLAYIVFTYFIIKMDKAYSGFLQLFRRLPPLACNLNHEIMGFLLNRKVGKENTKMTAAQSVVVMSPDSILLLNRNETIDNINPAITDLFGYTPNQLLGQPINNLLPDEYNQEIFNHLEMMRQGECTLIYEVEGIGKSDDDQEIPIHVTIIGFSDDNKTQANSFAIIIKDTTQLQKQRDEAENAKKQSEKLLYNILPRDIVNRINQGESEIFFSVPSASVIFIDIVKWSDYAANLTPSQIMSNLSLIFAKFDQSASKFNLITKIKLIGDVYMAAAGLFTPEIPPAQHAMQMVNFALEALLCTEDANHALDASLQVRIGINTDGPLLAGVLGTDKPVFDIIGDTINVASRLQSTCIPSTVQISQSTFNLISDMSYNIEMRGEIELKGKGKKPAYIVRPSLIGMTSSLICKSDKPDAFIGSEI